MPLGQGPPRAQCTACMKWCNCTTKRWNRNKLVYLEYDNFKFSEKHGGFICKTCFKKLEHGGPQEYDRIPIDRG